MLFARFSLLPRASIPFFSQCVKTTVPRTMLGVSQFSQSCVNQVSFHARRKFTSSVKQNVSKRGVVQKSSKSANESIDATASAGANLKGLSFSQRWMAPKEIPPKGTLKWYGEMALICTVFAITGTSTMILVRPAVSNVLGLKGSMKEGPWSYRICSLIIMTPLYSALLVCVGTVFGRHHYFRHFAVKMFSRFGIPPELMDKSFHETAKNFRKY